jgi:integrase/recombinase XerD
MTRYRLWMQMEGKPDTTIYARTTALKRAKKIIGVPVEDADRDQLLHWRAALNGRAATYILAQVSHIRCYLTWLCEEDGYRPDNPGRRIPVPRKPCALPHPISEADLQDAIDHATGRIRCWLVLGGWAGMRPIEIALLRRKYIRERDPEPHIFIAADATKGIRERVIPLSPYVIDELRIYGLPAGGWAFPRLDGEPGALTPHRVSTLCCRHLHSLGYSGVFYDTRHRFGTEMRKVTDIRVVQVMMGHARLDTTAIYTFVSNPEGAAAVAALPAPRRRLKPAGLTSSGELNVLPATPIPALPAITSEAA